jgi:hypothetical protein
MNRSLPQLPLSAGHHSTGVHSITTRDFSYELITYESITCPPFIPRCESNTEHYLQQFMLFRVYSLLCKRVLIPQQPKRCLANRALANRCIAMDVYSVADNVTSGTCLPSRCLPVVICVTIYIDTHLVCVQYKHYQQLTQRQFDHTTTVSIGDTSIHHNQ